MLVAKVFSRSLLAAALVLICNNFGAAQCKDVAFETALNSQAGNSAVSRIIAADFNNDGNNDLVTIGEFTDDAVISIMLGKGDGKFNDPATVLARGEGTILYRSPLSGIAADFNKDNFMDLLIVNFRPASFQIYLGQGDGTFQFGSEFFVRVDESTRPGVPTIGDMNYDGSLDILDLTGPTISRKNGVIDLFWGNGDGTFQTGPSYDPNPRNLPSGTVSTSTALGMSNVYEDGHSYILMSTRESVTSSLRVRIVECDASGNMDFVNDASMPVAYDSINFIADVNGDRVQDMISFIPSKFTVNVQLGNRNGAFSRPIQSKIKQISGAYSSLHFADFNSDGNQDIALTTINVQLGESTVYIFKSIGNGKFLPKAETSLTLASGATDVFAIDLTGSNRSDLATYPATDQQGLKIISIYLNACR